MDIDHETQKRTIRRETNARESNSGWGIELRHKNRRLPGIEGLKMGSCNGSKERREDQQKPTSIENGIVKVLYMITAK